MMQASSPVSALAEKADRVAKRHAVLCAAVCMFNERGFHSTSLDDVAASLGISKRTIYHHFANKDQLPLECLTIGMKQLLQAAEEVRLLPGNSYERLIQFLRRYAEINIDDFGRCVIRTAEESLTCDSLLVYRSLKRQIDTALRVMVAEAVAEGTIAASDVKMIAFTLAGALNWPARWHEAEGSLTPQKISVAIVDVLIQGLSPRC